MSTANALKAWRKRAKHKIVLGFKGKCGICGYDKFEGVLELHHLDPTQKDIGISDMFSSPKKWDKIAEEASKCIMVCSNCHKEIHAGLVVVPDNVVRFDMKLLEGYEDEKDKCPVCGNDKQIHNKTCSHKCAGTLCKK